ncbi:MAG: deoxyribose-phosphate aldolase [Bacteroidota bacterium]
MNIANYIDHTLLRPDCTLRDLELLCEEANEHGFYAICIPPFFIQKAVRTLERSPVKIATVVGFPLGYSAVAAKIEEIKRALQEGADEIDAVINICAAKSARWSYLKNEIDGMTTAAHMKGKSIKLILETGLLNKTELKKLCDICNDVGVDYVKNATGFNAEGASVDVVKTLRQYLSPEIKIKAAGGVRTAEFARELIAAGADRLGSSTSVLLL